MVKVEKTDGKVKVTSPYNSKLPEQARKLGGKWDRTQKVWIFDEQDEIRVRNLYKSVYGTDGDVNDTVNIRVEVKYCWSEYCQGLYLFGKPIAYATGRDSGARICEDVVVLMGGIESGGSNRNRVAEANQGTIFEVRRVPRVKVEEFIKENDDQLEITILEDKDERIKVLLEEKARIEKRLKDIDDKLIELVK